MSIAATHNTRTAIVGREVARRLVRSAIRAVRDALADAGGTWTPELRDATHDAANLRVEREFATVITWHASEATLPERWESIAPDADERLALAANRVLRKVGPRMLDFVTAAALDAVYTHLGEEGPVVTNLRARDARYSDPDDAAGAV